MNAVNGAETASDMLPPIPVSRDQVYGRLKRMLLWEHRTLIAAALPGANALAQPEYVIFEAELRDGGTVRKIDLVDRAIALGVLDPREESVMQHWSEGPG